MTAVSLSTNTIARSRVTTRFNQRRPQALVQLAHQLPHQPRRQADRHIDRPLLETSNRLIQVKLHHAPFPLAPGGVHVKPTGSQHHRPSPCTESDFCPFAKSPRFWANGGTRPQIQGEAGQRRPAGRGTRSAQARNTSAEDRGGGPAGRPARSLTSRGIGPPQPSTQPRRQATDPAARPPHQGNARGASRPRQRTGAQRSLKSPGRVSEVPSESRACHASPGGVAPSQLDPPPRTTEWSAEMRCFDMDRGSAVVADSVRYCSF